MSAVLIHKWRLLKRRWRDSYRVLFPRRFQQKVFINNQHVWAEKFRPMVTSKEFNQKPKLIYLHVPKTAGTAFTALCNANFPGAAAISPMGEFDPVEWSQASVVGGHFHYVCYEAAGPGHIFLGVLRDPVERALSLFRWYGQLELNREFRESRDFDHASMRNTLKKSIFHMEFMHNPQCRYLSNSMKFSDTLKVMKSRPFIVGTFEQLGDWIDVLSNEFGWPPLELPVANRISTKKPDTDDKKVLAMLRRHNRQDQLLYEYVRNKGVFNSVPADFDRSPFMLPTSTRQSKLN